MVPLAGFHVIAAWRLPDAPWSMIPFWSAVMLLEVGTFLGQYLLGGLATGVIGGTIQIIPWLLIFAAGIWRPPFFLTWQAYRRRMRQSARVAVL